MAPFFGQETVGQSGLIWNNCCWPPFNAMVPGQLVRSAFDAAYAPSPGVPMKALQSIEMLTTLAVVPS